MPDDTERMAEIEARRVEAVAWLNDDVIGDVAIDYALDFLEGDIPYLLARVRELEAERTVLLRDLADRECDGARDWTDDRECKNNKSRSEPCWPCKAKAALAAILR